MPTETLLLLFGAAFAANLVLTPLFIRLARLHGFLDHPGHRKIHTTPVAKLGGAALLLSTLASLILILVLFEGAGEFREFRSGRILAILLLTLAFALLGFLDDLFDLKPRYKLLLQTLLLGSFCLWAFRFEAVRLPGFPTLDLGLLAVPLTLLWLLAVVNGFNFADGSDGLAACVAGVSLLGFVALGLLSGGLDGQHGVAVAVLGSLTVFLAFNWRPARIYLGDTGSNALGAFLGASLVAHGTPFPSFADPSLPHVEPVRFHFLAATLLVGYPLLEVGLSTLRRLTKRVKFGRSMEWSEQEHIHHLLLRGGSGTAGTALAAAGVQAALGAAGLAAMMDQNALATLLILPLLMLGAAFMPRLGFFEFLGHRADARKPHYRIAIHFSALQKIKLELAGSREEVLALVAQACRELGVRRFRFIVKPDGKGFGGMDYQCRNTSNPQERPGEPPVDEGDAGQGEFFDYYEVPGHRGEAFWVFDSHTGTDELDVEYRILMSDFMKASLEACIRMGEGKEHLALGNLVRLPHHRTSGHALRRSSVPRRPSSAQK